MTKNSGKKLPHIVICLHILLLLLITTYFMLMLGGTETAKSTSGDTIEVYRFRSAMFIVILLGLSMSIPIAITNVLYTAKYLYPGDKRRILLIISTSLFAPLAILFILVTVMIGVNSLKNPNPPTPGPQDVPLSAQLAL